MTKIIFFDADGVLFDNSGFHESSNKIALSSWNALFYELGIYNEHERLKQLYLKGAFPTYMEWTDEACRVLQKHLTKQQFDKFVSDRPFMKNAKETILELKKRGYKTALISGGFQQLADKAKNLLGLDYAVAHCDLIFNKSSALQKWKVIPCDFEGKTAYFKKIADKEGIDYSQCVYVGDNVNDIPIFRDVELAIAFNATKDEVKNEADVVIESNDLSRILEHIM